MVVGIEASHAQKKDRTGVEEYCFQIIQHLKHIIPLSVRVILYIREPLVGVEWQLPSSWESHVLRWPFSKLWTQLRLSAHFLRHQPDIFFAPGQLIPFISPRRTVATVHDSAFIAHPEAYHFFGRMYLRYMNRLIVRKSAHIITPSEFSKQELIIHYHRSPEGISVVPEAYDRAMYNIKEDAVERVAETFKKYGITKPFIMTIGRLETKKNTKCIIEMFDILRKTFDIQLVLVGKPGVGYDAVKTQIMNSNYREDIKEVGYIPKIDSALLLRHAEVFVFPSLYEGFGIPVLEAMATGCPVVASRGTSLEEVGSSAICYCDPYNVADMVSTIRSYMEDKEMRLKQVQQGLHHAQQFSWEAAAHTTWGILASLVK